MQFLHLVKPSKFFTLHCLSPPPTTANHPNPRPNKPENGKSLSFSTIRIPKYIIQSDIYTPCPCVYVARLYNSIFILVSSIIRSRVLHSFTNHFVVPSQRAVFRLSFFYSFLVTFNFCFLFWFVKGGTFVG